MPFKAHLGNSVRPCLKINKQKNQTKTVLAHRFLVQIHDHLVLLPVVKQVILERVKKRKRRAEVTQSPPKTHTRGPGDFLPLKGSITTRGQWHLNTWVFGRYSRCRQQPMTKVLQVALATLFGHRLDAVRGHTFRILLAGNKAVSQMPIFSVDWKK